MTVLTEYTGNAVNVLGIGVIPGEGLSAAIRTDNAQRINDYLGKGFSIYFPSGSYEISDTLSADSETDVKIWGDRAIVKQVTASRRVISLTNCDRAEISGLTLRGAYYDRQTLNNLQWQNESVIYLDTCDFVFVDRNYIEGFEGTGVGVVGGEQITITNNQFRDGTWGDPGGGDIDVYGSNSRQLVITGNQCNTDSFMGIIATFPLRNVVVSDNVVVSMDKTGTELNGNTRRKAGIELQYHTNPALGNNQVDDSQYEYICADNKVTGCRYSGISFQSFERPSKFQGGVRGTITGNTIRYAGQELGGSVEDFVINGIYVDQFRDVVISNNTITDVRPRTGGSNERAGIAVGSNQPLQDNPTTWPEGGQSHAQCVINGNIIKRIEGDGIRLRGDGGDHMVSNNLVYDATVYQLFQAAETGTLSRFGSTTLTNNRFSRVNGTINSPGVQLRGDGQKVISGNVFEMTSPATSAGALPCLSITSDNAVITSNRFIGSDNADTLRRGIAFTFNAAERKRNVVFADNVFSGLYYGLTGDTEANNSIIIGSNNSFADVNYPAFNINYMDGQWGFVDQAVATTSQNLVAYFDGIPTRGDFLVGDIVWNARATSGNPMGWICTAAGNPGTWAAMANIP